MQTQWTKKWHLHQVEAKFTVPGRYVAISLNLPKINLENQESAAGLLEWKAKIPKTIRW